MLFVGAVLAPAALTNAFVRVTGNISRSYSGICMGGWGTALINAPFVRVDG
jgi:hypothetical protein